MEQQTLRYGYYRMRQA